MDTLPTSPTYRRHFKVRHYECDALGHVNNAVYLHYLQQTAIEASAALGFGMDWYGERGTVWVIRRLSIEYLQPALAGDDLEVTTWVSSFQRVRSNREYEVRRGGELIARAQADWVYIDRDTSRPVRVPAEAVAMFQPDGRSAVQPHRTDPALEERTGREFRSRRRVQRYELDPMVHVNNAVYLNWLEQAVFDACAEAGWPWARWLETGIVVVQRRHEVEYFRPALVEDEIEIVSRVVGVRRVTGTWQQDVLCIARDGQPQDPPLLLARDYNQGAFLTLDGRPARLPEDLIDALTFVAGTGS